jgi:predicted Kef-type K+ transport protein
MEELIWIGPALIFGLLATRMGLPPMVGYLIGGFILNIYGMSDPVFLTKIGNLGVTLLLFTVGLKLDVRSLLKPYVWAGATLHMIAVVAIFGIILFWISLGGLAIFADVDLGIAFLIAFALSFSSTVFAIKVLEERGELSSRHGQVAIGILIMQDIIAVIFLALSTGKIPSIWALALFALIPLRPVFKYYMSQAGHGELLVLYGLGVAFGSYALFNWLGVKGDLGALLLGAMLASHSSAPEMYKKLNGFKDFLLIGFFLSIGTAGHITATTFIIAFILALVVIIKVHLYFLVFTTFRLRVRTSVLASFNLANYSEFGLIVGAIALYSGWLSGDWLVIIALALTLTFIIAAPLNERSRAIYTKFKSFIYRFERKIPLTEDIPIDSGDARIAIIGMARLGTGAYDTLKEKYGEILLGTDPDQRIVDRHQRAGRNVILADATNEDFWIRLRGSNVEIVLLAKRDYEENIGVARLIKELECDIGYIATVADYPDQVESFKSVGVNSVWDFDTEAGTGFADEVIAQLGDNPDVIRS